MATAPDNRLNMREMTADDLPAAHQLSKAERWPHRLDDWQMMLSLGSGIVAEIGGELIGTAMWFPAGAGRATIGMVIVSPSFRKGGIGRLVLDAALDRAGATTLMLHSTQAAVGLYRRVGFRSVAEILQHQGAAFQVPVAALQPGARLRPIGQRDHDRVRALVADATGLDRAEAISALIESASMVGLDRAGELAGVAFFRRFGQGYAIGPVVAPTLTEAKVLISHWLGSRMGQFTRIDIPVECGLSDWLEELGLVQHDRVVTMVRGEALPAPHGDGRSFAILSQAFG